jgi:peptidoglycan/xylan/chitin deacetylase (PgdA/CDA1 family)
MALIRAHLVADAALLGATVGVGAALGCGWPLAGLATLGAGLQAWATVSPRSSWFLPVHWRLPPGDAGFALTFDDGPHPEHTPAILDLLAAHGQRATFFVIGEHAGRHGPLLRRMRAEGHAIGLHSHRHSRLFNLWPRQLVRRDLERCCAAVADATGEAPPRLFRPPVGLKNPLVADVVEALGLVTVTWSARVWDTRGAAAGTVAHRLRRAARPRAIVLLHDGHEPAHPGDRSATVAALAAALPLAAGRSRPLAAAGRAVTLLP